jgi:hypothetical protein
MSSSLTNNNFCYPNITTMNSNNNDNNGKSMPHYQLAAAMAAAAAATATSSPSQPISVQNPNILDGYQTNNGVNVNTMFNSFNPNSNNSVKPLDSQGTDENDFYGQYYNCNHHQIIQNVYQTQSYSGLGSVSASSLTSSTSSASPSYHLNNFEPPQPGSFVFQQQQLNHQLKSQPANSSSPSLSSSSNSSNSGPTTTTTTTTATPYYQYQVNPAEHHKNYYQTFNTNNVIISSNNDSSIISNNLADSGDNSTSTDDLNESAGSGSSNSKVSTTGTNPPVIYAWMKKVHTNGKLLYNSIIYLFFLLNKTTKQ